MRCGHEVAHLSGVVNDVLDHDPNRCADFLFARAVQEGLVGGRKTCADAEQLKRVWAGSKCRRQVPELFLRKVSRTWRLNTRLLTSDPCPPPPSRFGCSLISLSAERVHLRYLFFSATKATNYHCNSSFSCMRYDDLHNLNFQNFDSVVHTYVLSGGRTRSLPLCTIMGHFLLPPIL